MRPLKLTMSAFGPYSGVEVIDFTSLNDKNIFLITGPTGAGKTTIFDALSYALFGEASGSSRDKDTLRSDFALPETPTYVELIFELRGKQYKITRYPQQDRKKLRGEGFSFKIAEAELTLPEGDIVTRINTVDEKISSILGINKNQFRQIVMLPQGEFRRLLEAESKDREEIFRKIFGTYAFESIQKKLDDMQKSIYYKIKETKTKRDTQASNLNCGDDELLFKLKSSENLNIIEIINRTKELVKIDTEEEKNIDKKRNEIKLEHETVQKSMIEGIEINKKLQEKEKLEAEYRNMLLNESMYKEKQTRLDKARKALEVKGVEEAYRDREKNLDLKKLAYNEAEKRLIQAEKNVNLYKEKLEAEEKKESERKRLSDTLATLKNTEEKVKAYEEKSAAILKLKSELVNNDNYIKNLRITLSEEKAKSESLNESILEIQKAEIQKEKLDNIINNKDKAIKELRELYALVNGYIKNVDKHKIESSSFEEFNNKYIAFKNRYEAMEDKFRRGQAGILAQDLQEGSECPVCGSIHHPKLASIFSGVPTEKELKEAKEEFERLSQEREKRYINLSKLNGAISTSKEQISVQKEKLMHVLGSEALEISEKEIIGLIGKHGEKLSKELQDLNREKEILDNLIKNKASLESSMKNLLESIKVKENSLQDLENKYREFYAKVRGEEETLKNFEEEIPEDIRSYKKLLSRVSELESNIRLLEKDYKTAQENYNKANNEYASSKTDIEGKKNNIEEAIKEVQLWEKNLNNKIIEAGFDDYEQYTSTKLSEENIKELEKNILEYYQRLKSLKDRVQKAESDVEGLQIIDIEEFKAKLDNIKLKEEELEKQAKDIFSRINNNKKILKQIEEINEAIKEDEEKYKVIGELSRIANGDNSERISFERYVLAAYFDEIISAANIRLNKMAGGRFILKRKEEKGKGRKQEGLELEVFDNYTGKSRHVKTLSGGESFKASLALALGLADVVQAYAGGISLDTMFVDEGFGTLDPESLDNAIQCLIDLQKGGRLVGIISHVPELKERIDARLEVTPAKEGSKTKFVV